MDLGKATFTLQHVRVLATALIFATAALSACDTVRQGVMNESAPVVGLIPDQAATIGEAFTLDFTPYVSDDSDTASQLRFEVISGEGSFNGPVYEHTFDGPGVYVCCVRITDTSELVTQTFFAVYADYSDNSPPAIGSIPYQMAYLGREFLLNLSSYVSDDHDLPTELLYKVISGPGLFFGPVYAHEFRSEGEVTVRFSVSDLGGLNSDGVFSVNVQPSP